MANAKTPSPQVLRKSREAPAVTQQIAPSVDKPAGSHYQNLNFKVSTEFKKTFKRYALDHDLTMIELLAEGFDLVQQKRGRAT